jgi:hypothetical protein
VFRAAGGISKVANLSSPTPVATALMPGDDVLPALDLKSLDQKAREWPDRDIRVG